MLPVTEEICFVYFDLDDTLLDHRQAERRALEDMCSVFADQLNGHRVDHVCATYSEHNMELWRSYGDGDISKEELQRLRFERLLESLDVASVTPERFGTAYLDAYQQHWSLFEGAREVFESLAERFPVGVITNGFSELQHAKMARFPAIRDALQTLIISDEVGYPKPDPRIFAHAEEAAGVSSDEILYIGNSYHSDVCGGYEAGWRVAWLTDANQPPPEMDPDCVHCFRDWNDWPA